SKRDWSSDVCSSDLCSSFSVRACRRMSPAPACPNHCAKLLYVRTRVSVHWIFRPTDVYFLPKPSASFFLTVWTAPDRYRQQRYQIGRASCREGENMM